MGGYMPYKSLLTILPMEEDLKVLMPTITLAKNLGAHLDIVIVGELSSPSDYFYGGVGDESWKENNREVYKHTEKLNEAVEVLVAENKISANVIVERQFKEITGSVLSRYTLCTDLNVLTFDAIYSEQQTIKSYYRALIAAGKPVIILNDKTLQPLNLSKVVLAWNGKAEAAKAIQLSLPMLKHAENVHLVMIDPDKSELGANPGHDMATYIARHGVKLTVDSISSGGNTIADALLQRTIDLNADLLVMGAYGTTKLREWLLGGTTQHILKEANSPIFLCH